MPDLRSLPSVDALLRAAPVADWVEIFGRPLV
ncbi:MAG: hypothetical protein D6803_08210, partial [Anaerolineae bacterium]